MAKHIPMSFFANHELKARIGGLPKDQGEVVGQMIGIAFSAKRQTVKSPDGQESESIKLLGDFEATRYFDNSVRKANVMYLPHYMAELVEERLKTKGGSVQMAFNIRLVSTHKAIPVTWEVESAMEREYDDPLEAIKRRLQAAGTLKLPAPVAAPAGIAHAATPQVGHDPETGELTDVEDASFSDEIEEVPETAPKKKK